MKRVKIYLSWLYLLYSFTFSYGWITIAIGLCSPNTDRDSPWIEPNRINVSETVDLSFNESQVYSLLWVCLCWSYRHGLDLLVAPGAWCRNLFLEIFDVTIHIKSVDFSICSALINVYSLSECSKLKLIQINCRGNALIELNWLSSSVSIE